MKFLNRLNNDGSINPEKVSNNMQCGIDVHDRMVFSDPQIQLLSLGDFVLRCRSIINQSGDDKSDLNFFISSYGGDVHTALGIIDYMRIMKLKVNTIGIGPIMSAAVPILASGTGKRSITRNSVVMIHPVSAMFNGTALDLTNDVAQAKQSQDKIFGILGKYSTQTASFWKKKASTNFYLSPEQCLSFGLVDEIIDDHQKI
ncbi:MAG: ATP-dependent Clp protease proteolytic subunit [Ignavibacteriales bacterium]|nr:ATP-dependent Clp protease proteolytic subunit [Ignavibacteriales bacterium]